MLGRETLQGIPEQHQPHMPGRMNMQKDDRTKPEQAEGPNEGNAWLNIGKIVFLVIVLVAAWFVLEWLMGK